MSWLTKKIPTILGLLVLVGVVVGAGWWILQKQTAIPTGITPEKVQITNVQDNKFSVSWITKNPSLGKIVWGKVGEKLTQEVSDERGGVESTVHQVTVEELQPNTQYAFRIVSGTKNNQFDNNGSPYAIKTGPVIGNTPPSRNFYGQVKQASGQISEGIVYLALPNAAVSSSLITKEGNYAFTLSTVRTSDYQNYIAIDPAATIANLTIEDGKNASTEVSVSMVNAAPVPLITLGKNESFLADNATVEQPAVAEVAPTAETPSIFNVEPLTTDNEVNVVETQDVKILNPATDGETLLTLTPEFRGSGPRGTILALSITGKTNISDAIDIDNLGSWSYSPEAKMKVGNHTLTVLYISSGGVQKTIERTFVISDPGTEDTAAFVATPSASTKASALPSPSPREAMPATDEGVPVTGVIENTIGLLIMGALLVGAGIIFLL